ncbi:hypothetical protein [uncultured Chryseobacterium sp.]|uniref:hypothetical protein n=1 Tax=uncultured Chryseobacterium sp. TaxID=259322 RepID=UPI00262C0585|nr:hypothetical protein [uncultured Chryseobacterium sp.]
MGKNNNAYNKNYGDISFGIPFDLDKRRITTFQVNDKNDKSGLGNLRTNIQNAINIIIASNPRKEISRSKLSDAEIKRNKDILVLVELLSTISLPIFDIFLLRAPRIIESRILHFWESFNGVYKSSHFHIYNKELIKILNDFHDLWDKSLTYGNYYKSNAGILKFGINNSDEEFEKLAELEQLIKLLSEKKKEFLNYIQEHYLEIDLRVTSENAAKEYNSFNGLG